ncbi:MAG: hypothetical protein K8W52_14575 [Deltaproteobacteria bacterium]|nr:hypothetical protein [Deltaproteobacteria bacterium]
MRRLIAALACAGCGAHAVREVPRDPAAMAARVVADFERATRTSRDAYLALFDFDKVGVYEILLRRLVLVRFGDNLDPDERARYQADDGTPYPAARERKNVGTIFFDLLARRTVGTGGCAVVPTSPWNQALLAPVPPLPADSAAWEPLRAQVNPWLARGGVVDLRCAGGEGTLTLAWTTADTPRGYALITMYDDVGDPAQAPATDDPCAE